MDTHLLFNWLSQHTYLHPCIAPKPIRILCNAPLAVQIRFLPLLCDRELKAQTSSLQWGSIGTNRQTLTVC